jgi:RNA polymerase sigma factor (sigma-70 family)
MPEAAAGGRFPPTRCSVLLAASSADPEVRRRAFETLVTAYWKPVYKYLRVKWGLLDEDAQDLTQAFFAVAFEKGYFERYDPARARFRTFLRTCLDGFAANQRKSARRLKRGGGARVLSLDFGGAEGELLQHEVADGLDLDDYFRREWVRHLFTLAVESLRAECARSGKATCFALFERYDVDGPDAAERLTYARLAEEFGLPVTRVTNDLAWARREFRRLVLETLREISGSEAEFRAEARALLGFEP